MVEILEDDAGLETWDDSDAVIYRVALADQDVSVDVRWRNLRSA